jgi:hypothetical protein
MVQLLPHSGCCAVRLKRPRKVTRLSEKLEINRALKEQSKRSANPRQESLTLTCATLRREGHTRQATLHHEVEIASGLAAGDLIALNVGEGVEDGDAVQPVVLAGSYKKL